MQLKLIKKKENTLLILLGLILFIFAQNAILFSGFNQNSDTLNEANLFKENDLLNDRNSIDNFVSNQLKTDENKNTYILKLSLIEKKSELLKFIDKNKYEIIDYLDSLETLIVKASFEEITEVRNRFHVAVSNNEKWQGIPNFKDLYLLKSQQENNKEYENPRTTINIGSLTETGKNTNIAILDTGIDTTHPDFENIFDRVDYQESFVSTENGYSVTEEKIDDFNGHGTHVAGIAAGSGTQNSMYLGIAPNAKLTILKIGSSVGEITTIGLLTAVERAIERNVDVISLSVGFFPSDPDNVVSLAVDTAVAKGVNVVVSAGNSGSNNGTIASPASSRLSISVGAYDTKNGNVVDFSSRGLSKDGRIDPDIVAPGVNIRAPLASNSLADWSVRSFEPSPIIDSKYIAFSGTSMSAPIVTGAIALILEKYPDLNPMTIRTALTKHAKDFGSPENVQGAGLLDIQSAMNYIASNSVPEDVWNYLPKKGLLTNSEIPRIIFPTEEYSLRIFFTSTEELGISAEILDINAKNNASMGQIITVIEENKYESNSTFGAYTEIVIKIKPLIGALNGGYSGFVNITINGSPYNLIPIGDFVVKNPETNIYWSSYHSDNGYSSGDYRQLDTILRRNSVYIKNYDRILSFRELNQFDIVILSDVESILFQEEMNSLYQYIISGGNIMVLGSIYPFSNNDNLNIFTRQFGLEFLTKTFWNVENDGIQQILRSPEPVPLELNLTETEIFSSVTGLSWYDGSMLSLSSNDTVTLASVTIKDIKYPVQTIFNGNNTVKGKLFISGQNTNLENRNLDQLGNDSLYFLNIIKNFESDGLNLKLFMNSTNIQKDSNELFSIRVFDDGQQQSLDSSAKLNVTIINPNNTTNMTFDYNTNTDQFIFNKTFDISGSNEIMFQYNSISKNISLKVYEDEIIISINVENDENKKVDSGNYPGYLSDESSIFVSTYGMKIKFAVNSTSNNNIMAAITFLPKALYENSGSVPIVDEIFSEVLLSSTKHGFIRTFTFSIPDELSVGFYLFQIYSEVEDFELLSGNMSSIFLIVDKNPEIDLENSIIKGNEPFSNYEFANDEEPKLLTVYPGEEISFDIYFDGSEKSSYFQGAMIYTPYFTFLDTGYIFDIGLINQTEQGRIQGSYTIPENTTIELSNFKIILDQDNVLSLFVVVWDDSGNYDLFVFFISLQRNVFSSLENLILPFIAIILFPLIFLFVVMYRSSKKRKDQDIEFRLIQEQRMMNKYQGFSNRSNVEQQYFPQQPIETEKITPMFCGNCGAPISPGETFCMECGKKVT